MPVAALMRALPAAEVEEWRAFFELREEQMKKETLRAEMDAKAAAGAERMRARARPRAPVRRR